MAGTLTVLIAYAVASRMFNRRAGFLAGLVLGTAVFFLGMARLMLTDMTFTLFLSGSVFCFWLAVSDAPRRDLWVALYFVSSALAVITKGPLGSIIPGLAAVTFLWASQRPNPLRGPGLWWGAGAYTLIVAPWFAVMLWRYGWNPWDHHSYFYSFFIHENLERLYKAEHPPLNTPWFYLEVIALGSIPWLSLLGVAGARAWRDFKTRAPQLYLWCWLASGFGFLEIAQSKLPSYSLFLCVPLALLFGAVLDSLLTRDFDSRGELWAARFLCFAQAVTGFLVIHRWTSTWPALAVSACLSVPLVLLFWRASVAWIVATAANTLVVLVGTLVVAAPQIEPMISVKGMTTEIARETKPGEPILCSRSLARGIYYYTGRPTYVFSDSVQPFYSPHALPVILGVNGLRKYLQEHQSAPCVFTASNWQQFAASATNQYRDTLHFAGQKELRRLTADFRRVSPTP
jgi:4-amino-4-deoxy-L-arabinose transferase-like glycosyltransferase